MEMGERRAVSSQPSQPSERDRERAVYLPPGLRILGDFQRLTNAKLNGSEDSITSKPTGHG